MSYSDETSDEERDMKAKNRVSIKKEYNSSINSKTKYLQRFCDKWLELFEPWLARCDDDPNKPFCRACQCRLDCNKCHLERHERTSKHSRNLDILISKGESAARENLSIRQERSKYYQRRKQLNASQDLESAVPEEDTMEEYAEDTGELIITDPNFQFVQADNSVSCDQYENEPSMQRDEEFIEESRNTPILKYRERSNLTHGTTKKGASQIKKDRDQLLLQLKRNKHNIMDSFKQLISSRANLRLSKLPPKEHNPVDLFFQSVSQSVKALPFKLISEAKMRVSQLVCELELRALTEFDGDQTGVSTSVVVSTEVNDTTIEDQSAMDIHTIEDNSRRSHFIALS